MILWIILTVMIALAAVGLTIPLVRRYEQRPQAKTVDILKGQLGEVDAQVSASLIDPAEAEALRSEIKRRILVEDRDAGTAARPFPQAAMSWVALGLVAIVTLCATALYAMMGHPELTSIAATTAAGAPQAQSAAVDPKSHPNGQVASMISSLEAKLQQKPGDAQGWQMLAWSYMRTGRPADAAKAYAKAVAIDPKNVEYLAAQGEAMAQSEGKVSDDAAAIFQRALKGDPADPRARYCLAIHRDQTGDHKGAMDEFVALLKSAPPDAPWASQVRTYVEDLAKEQHVDLTGKLPSLTSAAASGPNSAQVAVAGKMSDADRQAMIHSMVDKLAGELKANPKDTGGWVRLMRARMVLGEGLQAAQDYKQARAAFAGDAAAQAALQEVAKSLGVPGA